MRRFLLPVLLFLCSLIAACDQASMLNKIASSEDQAFARLQVERLRARDFAAIERALDPSLAGPTLRPRLEHMAGLVPAGEPRSVKTVGALKHYRSGVTTLTSTIEYEFADLWLLAHVVVAEQDGGRIVKGFNVYTRSQSLEQENRFTLAGKGMSHYIMLVAALAVVGLTLAALVVCWRTRPRRRWLWIVFILLGFCRFTVNWNTGVVMFEPLSFQLFSAGIMAQFGQPWLLCVAVPLGAIVFLAREAKRQETEARAR